MTAQAWFWASAALVTYTYAGYPLLVAVMAALREPLRPPMLALDRLPAVTVVMAAHNEAGRLGEKFRNLRALDYPADRLQVLVVSDGSTDDTAAVVRQEHGAGLVAYMPRRGKAYALNRALAEVRTELVVFCDVRQELAPDAVRRLVSDLADPRIGAVSGELMYRSGATQAGRSIGLYWRYEKWIRKSESRLGSTVGVTGALYAMRRADWCDLREGTILDDFEVPMQVLRRGRRVLLDERAQIWDVAQAESSAERRRKIRTLSGNFQSFAAHPWLFSPLANPVWFQFMSHKVLRLLVPYALLACLASSVLASTLSTPLYRLALAAQLAFYGAAAAGRWWPRARGSRAVSFAHVFCDMNLAAVIALWRFARGTVDARWEKTS